MLKHFICLLFVVNALTISQCFSQKSRTDSLVNSLQTAKPDSNKVNTLNTISKLFRVTDTKQALHYAQEALKLAEKTRYVKGKGYALNNIGVAYHRGGDYKKSLEFHLIALKYWEANHFKSGIAASMHNIATVYHVLENLDKALEYNLQAYAIREEIQDNEGIAASLNNLGLVYESKKEYNKALPYHLKTLKILEKRGDKRTIAYSLHNIASLYYYLKQYDKAIDYYQRSLKIKEENNDLDGMASTSISLGNVYNETGDYKKAIETILTGVQIAKDIQALEWLVGGYQGLAVSHQKINDYRKAFEYLNLYTLTKDSLLNAETTEQISEMQTKYETEKKDAAIKLLNKEKEKQASLTIAENKRQRVILLSVSGFLLLVIGFAIFIYRSSVQKQKANRELALKNNKLENAYKVIEEQKHLVEEKHKEITDSINYAERIQRSFLATEQLLNENLNDYFVFFKPKDVVSGDFYWASKLNNGEFVIAVADSTGHGVPGAIMSILNISCLEKSVEEKQLVAPGEILNHTRTKIIERLKKDGSAEGGKDGMDCILIRFDLNNNKLIYSAANNPVWIIRGLEIIELAPDKMPVGKHDRDNVSFTEHIVDLQKNDVVYAITDGMPDQFGGPKGKKFMYKQLKELLISIAQLPAAEQKNKLTNALSLWTGDLEQVDDITIVGIRI